MISGNDGANIIDTVVHDWPAVSITTRTTEIKKLVTIVLLFLSPFVVTVINTQAYTCWPITRVYRRRGEGRGYKDYFLSGRKLSTQMVNKGGLQVFPPGKF